MPTKQPTPPTMQELALAALQAAMDFFITSTDWQLGVKIAPLRPGWCGQLDTNHQSLYAFVTVMPERMSGPEELWATVGHEIGHFTCREVSNIVHEWEEGTLPQKEKALAIANERAAIRLERIFVKACPMPKRFKAVVWPKDARSLKEGEADEVQSS